jgi:hypothetical protein
MALKNINHKTVYKCEYCPKEFNDGRKLGGHVSKAHPRIKEKVGQYLSSSKMEI